MPSILDRIHPAPKQQVLRKILERWCMQVVAYSSTCQNTSGGRQTILQSSYLCWVFELRTLLDARKTLDMEIFLSKKSEIRPPLPSELWTLIAPKLLKIKGSFFLPIKIWEICGHLQLVSCLYLHWSLCDSILKKSFQKSPLQEVAKCLHFWNFGKSASFWLAIALKPLGQFQITRYQ